MGIALCIYAMYDNAATARKAQEAQAAAQRTSLERAAAAHRNKQATALYKACLKRGIQDAASEENRKAIALVGSSSYHLTDQQAIQYFLAGEELAAAEKKKTSEENIKNNRFVYERQRNAMSTYSIGKTRYFAPHARYLELLKESYARSMGASSSSVYNNLVVPKKEDWAILGGLASGIAGPVAAAVGAQQRNAQRQADADAMNKAMATLSVLSNINKPVGTTSADVERYGEFCTWFHKQLQPLLVDNSRSQELHEGISFEIVSSQFKDGGFLQLSIRSKVTAAFELLNKPARIDGYYRIDVYDSDECIGEGYFTPYGIGETNLKSVGFQSSKTIKVMFAPHAGKTFVQGSSYQFRFVPLALWLIEAEDLGLYQYMDKWTREYKPFEKATYQISNWNPDCTR